MNRQQRLDAVHAAILRVAEHPEPVRLGDGLSAPMAEECLRGACALLDPASLARATAVPGFPPRIAAVVAARGVFTAPMEWVALLAAVGAEVVLKVPAAAPSFGQALAAAFSAEGLAVRCTTARDLPQVDAIVSMGNDQTVASLASSHPRARLSLHGHRFSVAVVSGTDDDLARGLALDAMLYDGRGCFTPVAVLHLGPPVRTAALVSSLAARLAEVSGRLPAGERDPLLGPTWRRRTGLARALGGLSSDRAPCTARMAPDHFEVAALPGFLPVHPVSGLGQVQALLAPYRPWLAACATDLDDATPLFEAGFERVCRPGRLQRPPIPRPHGGQEMLRPLMSQRSLEF